MPEFFQKVMALNYPKKRMDLFIHNKVSSCVVQVQEQRAGSESSLLDVIKYENEGRVRKLGWRAK